MLAICVGRAKTAKVELIPTDGGEPHVMDIIASDLDFDPTGRILAISDGEGRLYLWPVPEGQPTHTLPRDEFMEYLRSNTTARAVPDTSSTTGFKISYEPFKGWDALPQK